MSARILADVFNTFIEFMMGTFNKIDGYVVLSGYEKPLYTVGFRHVREDTTPNTNRIIFYGIIDVDQDGMTLDEIRFELRNTDWYCGHGPYVHRLVSVQPITLNQGLYGILVIAEYQPQTQVPVSLT